MAKDNNLVQQIRREKIMNTVSVGFFLILVGVIFVLTPNFFNKISSFFNDFIFVQVPNINNVYYPTPAFPNTHLAVYRAFGEFSLIWGIFQSVKLIIRITYHSSTSKISEGISSITFWLGISYLVSLFLNTQVTRIDWYMFETMTIALVGVSLIAKALTIAALRR